MDKKQQIIEALRVFMRQRSGMDFRNYGDVSSYRSEQRSVTKDLHEARELVRAVELRDSITAEDIIEASKRAFSGRLTIVERADGAFDIDYCTGQYFPTEYRKAICAVMAQAIWEWTRTQCMPAPEYVMGDGVTFKTRKEADEYAEHMSREYNNIISMEERYNGLSAGCWIRKSFRREYGRAIASRWFN